jgi:hypothetical protein
MYFLKNVFLLIQTSISVHSIMKTLRLVLFTTYYKCYKIKWVAMGKACSRRGKMKHLYVFYSKKLKERDNLIDLVVGVRTLLN